MRRAANRHPRAPQPISNGWGGAMTSPVLLSYPSPTRLLVLVARVEKFGVGVGDGKRTSDVTFPLCDWLLGGRTTTNQQSQKVWRGPAESPVATRKRDRERTSGFLALQCRLRAWSGAVWPSQFQDFDFRTAHFSDSTLPSSNLGRDIGWGNAALHSVGERTALGLFTPEGRFVKLLGWVSHWR